MPNLNQLGNNQKGTSKDQNLLSTKQISSRKRKLIGFMNNLPPQLSGMSAPAAGIIAALPDAAVDDLCELILNFAQDLAKPENNEVNV